MANIEALEQLKRVVRTTPEYEFNMGVWQCDSVACAFGSATKDRWFIDRGLCFQGEPTFKGEAGYKAAILFFGISRQESHFIFSSDAYINSAEYIEQFMKSSNTVRINMSASIKREHVIDRIDQVIDSYTVQKDAHLTTWRNYLLDSLNALTMLDQTLRTPPCVTA